MLISMQDMFSPLAFPDGIVVYDLTTASTTPLHRSLAPFELYRENLAVIAVADGREYSDKVEDGVEGRNSALCEFQQLSGGAARLKDSYPSAFVHEVFVFDWAPRDTQLPQGLVAVPPKDISNTTTMKTIMCDMTSKLLAEMTTFAISVQALPNLEVPRPSRADAATGDGIGRGTSRGELASRPGSRSTNTPEFRAGSPANESDRHIHRASLPAHPTTLNSKLANEHGRPRSAADDTKTPPVTFDDMNELPERPNTTSATESTGKLARDRVSVHGFGSGSLGERARNQAKSRIGVVIGSMHLLAGRWSDALKELVESVAAAKSNSDYAWYAKALDYLLVTILMYAWAGKDVEIPSVLYPFGDKSALIATKASKQAGIGPADTGDVSSESTVSRANTLQDLCALLPDLTNNILHLYSRAAQFSSTPVPQVVFSDTIIRLTKLLSLIHNCHGSLTGDALRFIVLNESSAKEPALPEEVTPSLSKADISTILYRGLPSSSSEESVDILDRLSILAGMASVLSSLGLHRKKAFILRELLSSLLPALIQSRKQSAAEQGVHPAASLSTFDFAGSEVGVGGVLGKHGGMDPGIQNFLMVLCKVYGANLTKSSFASPGVKSYGIDESSRDVEDWTGSVARTALANATKRAFGNSVLKLDILRSCINTCEALPDLRGVLRFSSDLLCTAGSGIAPGPGTTDSSPSIPMEDQARLVNNIMRTVSAAKQLGFENLEAEYWDEFLLRDVEILSHNSMDSPLARHKSELKLAANIKEKNEGPFIYNPFARPGTSIKDTLLIADEEVTFVVLLQNLYDFELEVEWIRFDVDENLLHAKAQNIVIGAYRTQQVHILATPKADGQLRIDSCIAKIKGCRAKHFPLFRSQWRMKDELKVKRHGLAAAMIPKERPVSVSSDPGKSKTPASLGVPAASSFEARIIKSQPTVVLKSTSLSQSAIMVLEGERRRFTMTLQNHSKTAVDLLLLSVSDSSAEALQAHINNNDLTPAELYEAEVDAYHRPGLSILPHSQGEELKIPANGTLTVGLEIFGKHGLMQATVVAEYGYLGVPRDEVEDKFYTRRITIPFSVTVSPSAGLVHNDFLPFTGDFAWSNQMRNRQQGSTATKKIEDTTRPEQRFQRLLNRLGLGSQGDDHCLVILDFFNNWSSPLSLSLQVRSQLPQTSSEEDGWKRAYSVHETLQPGCTTRVIVLLPRLVLKEPHTSVPSMRNKRQFVVSASKISPDFERLSRELFWYREEAFKYMRATWQDVRSSRTGDLDLRRLSVTPRMLDTLKLDEVGIDMALLPCRDDPELPSEDDDRNSGLRQRSRTHFTVSASSFFNLTTTLTSRLPHPIYPLLRLQPALRNQPYNVALDLSKKLAFNGVLQRPLPLLQPGEKRDVSTGVVFLAAGEYDFGACVEEVRVWRDKKPNERAKSRPRAGTGELRAEDLIRTDRRTWFAREACSVDVTLRGEEA